MANGLTVAEMAKELSLATDTVKRRLQTKGIKPVEYAGPTALYDKSALEAIRVVDKPGRPPKAKKPANKAKKPKK